VLVRVPVLAELVLVLVLVELVLVELVLVLVLVQARKVLPPARRMDGGHV